MNIKIRLADGSVDSYIDGDDEEEIDEDLPEHPRVMFNRHEYRIGDTGTLLLLRRRCWRVLPAADELQGAKLLETTKAALYEPVQWTSVREVD